MQSLSSTHSFFRPACMVTSRSCPGSAVKSTILKFSCVVHVFSGIPRRLDGSCLNSIARLPTLWAKTPPVNSQAGPSWMDTTSSVNLKSSPLRWSQIRRYFLSRESLSALLRTLEGLSSMPATASSVLYRKETHSLISARRRWQVWGSESAKFLYSTKTGECELWRN